MSDYLPDSLLPEILCRLPIESLLRFRSVSKKWCSVISSPHFISSYRSITTDDLLFLSHFSKEEKYSVYFDPCSKTKNLTLFKEFKRSFGNYFDIVGSCDGLFCLAGDFCQYGDTLILWNPAIRKSISLPDPSPCCAPYRSHTFSIGFGFDHKTHDFKVVYLERANDAHYMVPPKIEVYKLSTGLWETIDSKGIFNCKLYFEDCSIYLNGAIHWVANGENEGGEIINSLLVFDLSDETFREMGLPRVLATYDSDLSVTLWEERISVILFEHTSDYGPSCFSCVVWVMNEYGKTESWTQKFVVNLDSGINDAIGFTRNGEFLVVQYPGDLVSYDPEKRELKDLGIHGDSFFLSKYVESLVLLDRSSGATSESEEATKI